MNGVSDKVFGALTTAFVFLGTKSVHAWRRLTKNGLCQLPICSVTLNAKRLTCPSTPHCTLNSVNCDMFNSLRQTSDFSVHNFMITL